MRVEYFAFCSPCQVIFVFYSPRCGRGARIGHGMLEACAWLQEEKRFFTAWANAFARSESGRESRPARFSMTALVLAPEMRSASIDADEQNGRSVKPLLHANRPRSEAKSENRGDERGRAYSM